MFYKGIGSSRYPRGSLSKIEPSAKWHPNSSKNYRSNESKRAGASCACARPDLPSGFRKRKVGIIHKLYAR